MKKITFSLMLAALMAFCPVYGQSARGGEDAESQEVAAPKKGLRFVVCSAKNEKVPSPLWYVTETKSKDGEVKLTSHKISIGARLATPRIKARDGRVSFYKEDPIDVQVNESSSGQTNDRAAKQYVEKQLKALKEAEPYFFVPVEDPSARSLCIVMPKSEEKVDWLVIDEAQFPKRGNHIINLSSSDIEITVAEDGKVDTEKPLKVPAGKISNNKINASSCWNSNKHLSKNATQVAFTISYLKPKYEYEMESVDKKGRKLSKPRIKRDAKGKPVIKVRKDGTKVAKGTDRVTVRRSKFAVSEVQSVINVMVDDPAREGVKMISINLAD